MYVQAHSADWSDIHDRFSTELEDFVRSRVPALEADDLLQDLWATLAETLEQQVITQPRAWLYRVARNRITDFYRSRAARPSIVDVTETESPPDVETDRRDPDMLMEDIQEALEAIPSTQREVFVRNEMDGETLREIAADLGLPLKTVISRKGYARSKLKDLLAEAYEEYFGTD